MRFVPFALPPDAFRRRLGGLRFAFSKWDLHVRGRGTVAPGALVLTRREHEEIVRVAEGLHAAALEARRVLPSDPAASRALGVPDAVARLAAHEPEGATGVTRHDLFPTADGWMLSEFNDDVPGGYNDAFGLPALFADALEKDVEVVGDLPESLPARLASRGGAVGFVYPTAYAEDLQVVRLLADLVEAEGVATVLASPAHLRHEDGRTLLDGVVVSSVFRFFPAEWYPLLDNLDHWEAAVASGLLVVNPFRCAWTQSKGVFAWLRANASGAGGDLARRHLPVTRPLDADARADALDDPARWVLKPAFGRMGEGVELGALLPPDDWRKAVEHAAHRRRPTFLQERFHVLPVEVEPGRSLTPCVGVYLVDGRFAGYYSRLSEHRVVAYDAANVLTVVERV